MLGMPVATLRVWERRYALCEPALTPSGQRLYDDVDVQRLALIKRLTDVGHAIGRLAGLDMNQLEAVAATHAATLASVAAARGPAAVTAAPPLVQVRVVGEGLRARLGRLVQQRPLRHRVKLLAETDSESEANADLIVIHAPTLSTEAVNGVAPGDGAPRKAVLYAFGTTRECERLAAQGVALLREPQSDSALLQWLASLLPAAPAADAAPASVAWTASATGAEPAPRRWSDAALADFAGLSSTVACECPRHVAELLIQLSQFEAYSASCENRSPQDAALHRHLKQVTAQARVNFERALEYVALHEGLTLPD
jgi:MerR family transcriptional regulator, light-induced transcriptional regulator